MIAINTVLAATDFSVYSDAAVRYAMDLGRRFRAKVHLLHVVDQVALYATSLGSTALDFTSFQDRLEDDARARLEALVFADDRLKPPVDCTVFTASPTAATILEFAGDIRADVIVVGTHGRTGVKHLVLGSVAETIVRLARCPVLTVH